MGAPRGGTVGVSPETPPHWLWCPSQQLGLLQPHPLSEAPCGGWAAGVPGCGWFSPGQGSLLTPTSRLWALPPPLVLEKGGHVLLPTLLIQA